MKCQPKAASRRPGLHAWAHIAILLSPRLFAGYVSLMQKMLLVVDIMQARSVDVMSSRLFDIDVLSTDGAAVRSFGDMPVPAIAALTDAAYDVVIASAQFALEMTLDAKEAHIADQSCIRYEVGALVVGMSVAPLFAKAGLLDGCQTAGPASERAWFVWHFPSVHCTPDRPLAVDGRIITVNDINPVIDACVYVIDHHRGVGASQRMLRIVLTRSLPSYERMAVWMTQFRRHGDAAMLAIQEIVEQELATSPILAELAAQVTMGEWSLTRRSAVATGSNLWRYVATLRLELAVLLLRTGRQPFDHTTDECGYGSVSAPSRAFSAGHGYSPLQYRVQYRTR